MPTPRDFVKQDSTPTMQQHCESFLDTLAAKGATDTLFLFEELLEAFPVGRTTAVNILRNWQEKRASPTQCPHGQLARQCLLCEQAAGDNYGEKKVDFKTETQLRQEIDDAWRLVDQHKRVAEIYAAERDHAKACYDRAVRILTGIHALLYPPRMTDNDGRTWEFHSPMVHEQMQELSDRIRALPDEIAAIDAAMKTPNAIAQGREPHSGEASPGATGSTTPGNHGEGA